MPALGSIVDGGWWWFFLHLFLYEKYRLHSDDVEKPSTILHPTFLKPYTLRVSQPRVLVNARPCLKSEGRSHDDHLAVNGVCVRRRRAHGSVLPLMPVQAQAIAGACRCKTNSFRIIRNQSSMQSNSYDPRTRHSFNQQSRPSNLPSFNKYESTQYLHAYEA